MAKQKNLASKAKNSKKKFPVPIFPSSPSLVKYVLLPALMTFGTSGKVQKSSLSPEAFPSNMFFPAKEIPQSIGAKENIKSAFKKGYARTIGEFLDLYQSNLVIDTIVVNKDNVFSRMCLGRYLKHKDIVELKYFVPDTTDASPATTKIILNFCKKYNDTSFTRPVTAHEASHKTSHNEGKIKDLTYQLNIPNPLYFFSTVAVPYRPEEPRINVFSISLRDYAVINQWNEIGGDLGYIIYEREEFLRTGDASNFTYTTEYTKAVKNGTIDPRNNAPYARKLEYSLLVNSTIDWWLAIKKDGYAYTSKSDVESMIKSAKEKNILLATTSLPNKMQQRISSCLTFPLDGKMVDLSQYVKDFTMTPQPMVEQVIAQAEKEMPMYEYNDKPAPSPAILYLKQTQNNAPFTAWSGVSDVFNISHTIPEKESGNAFYGNFTTASFFNNQSGGR